MTNEMRDAILNKARSQMQAGDPMSIDEIAEFAERHYRELLSSIAKHHVARVRTLGYRKWSSALVIQDLNKRSKQ